MPSLENWGSRLRVKHTSPGIGPNSTSKSQHVTGNFSLSEAPVVITHSVPRSIVEDLNSALVFSENGAIDHQTNGGCPSIKSCIQYVLNMCRQYSLYVSHTHHISSYKLCILLNKSTFLSLCICMLHSFTMYIQYACTASHT